LPRPRVNHNENGRELDFHWPGSALVVEVDGWRYHRTRLAFAADRRRDRLLLRSGRHAVRYTGDEIEHTPAAVAAELRELLRRFPPAD
jgi:very-short-patch-repair endonuclease